MPGKRTEADSAIPKPDTRTRTTADRNQGNPAFWRWRCGGTWLALPAGMDSTIHNRLSMVLSRQRHNMVADSLFVVLMVLAMLLVLAPMY